MESDVPLAHLIHYCLNVSHKLTFFGPAWFEKLTTKIKKIHFGRMF